MIMKGYSTSNFRAPSTNNAFLPSPHLCESGVLVFAFNHLQSHLNFIDEKATTTAASKQNASICQPAAYGTTVPACLPASAYL